MTRAEPDEASNRSGGAVAAPQEVLDFWFGAPARDLWFARDAAFDAQIRQRFEPTVRAAAAEALGHWEHTPDGALALVILLDQFSRNLHRESPLAWANDALARQVADRAIARGFDRQVSLDRRRFFYLPLKHSESLADQRRCVSLFRAWAEECDGALREEAFDQLKYAERHAEIVGRFGRFPHRNKLLGRSSTAEEIAFLEEPMSAF